MVRVEGTAEMAEAVPPATGVGEYVETYRESVARIDFDPESFARAYSVAIGSGRRAGRSGSLCRRRSYAEGSCISRCSAKRLLLRRMPRLPKARPRLPGPALRPKPSGRATCSACRLRLRPLAWGGRAHGSCRCGAHTGETGATRCRRSGCTLTCRRSWRRTMGCQPPSERTGWYLWGAWRSRPQPPFHRLILLPRAVVVRNGEAEHVHALHG